MKKHNKSKLNSGIYRAQSALDDFSQKEAASRCYGSQVLEGFLWWILFGLMMNSIFFDWEWPKDSLVLWNIDRLPVGIPPYLAMICTWAGGLLLFVMLLTRESMWTPIAALCVNSIKKNLLREIIKGNMDVPDHLKGHQGILKAHNEAKSLPECLRSMEELKIVATYETQDMLSKLHGMQMQITSAIDKIKLISGIAQVDSIYKKLEDRLDKILAEQKSIKDSASEFLSNWSDSRNDLENLLSIGTVLHSCQLVEEADLILEEVKTRRETVEKSYKSLSVDLSARLRAMEELACPLVSELSIDNIIGDNNTVMDGAYCK